jgi:hypothetical protein
MRVFWKWNEAYTVLEKTTDGGDTWTEVPGPYGNCVPLNVCYVPGTSDGYVITGDINVNGYANGSAYTLDGGNTWTNLDNGNYCYMVFNSDQVGWATCFTTNNFYKYVGPPIPIPVELTSFTASVNGNDVSLNWATSTETNNKGFEVQRSEVGDQKSEWEKVGFVEGKGTTTEEQNYSFTDKKVPEGSYTYRLKQIDFNGAVNYSEEVNIEVKAVYIYNLNQNYPNPFNPATSIQYAISSGQFVTIKVYDILGNEVETLVNEYKPAGRYNVEFTMNNEQLSSGVYFYQLRAGSYSAIKKMIILK